MRRELNHTVKQVLRPTATSTVKAHFDIIASRREATATQHSFWQQADVVVLFFNSLGKKEVKNGDEGCPCYYGA